MDRPTCVSDLFVDICIIFMRIFVLLKVYLSIFVLFIYLFIYLFYWVLLLEWQLFLLSVLYTLASFYHYLLATVQ